jgi:hypothetical protein
MTQEHKARSGGKSMEGWFLLGFIALWFVLQLCVLPKLGVPT